MTGFAPTPAQARAITHPFADACVVAGAGSGKTAVLTQRFLQLVLEHGLPVRQVAALTFTEKAAGEMRERIAHAFDDAGRHDLRDEVEFAPISTIHAFCARLLRSHAVDAGLDPAFGVLDATESSLLKEDAFALARRELAAAASTAPLVLGRIEANAGALLQLLDDIRAAGWSAADLVWAGADVEVEMHRDGAREALRALLEAAAAEEDPVPARAAAAAPEIEAALASSETDAAWRLAGARAAAGTVRPPGRARGKKALGAARKELLEHLEALEAAALDTLARADVEQPVRDLLVAYERVYERLKDERDALDFTDLERRAMTLLDELAAKGRTPAGAPRALLVDEFQDTNPLQARLLERLRVAGAPMFSVGDPKQSIYRFRRADVAVIAAEFERVEAEGQHVLAATFRSRPGLVGALNSLNESIFAGGAAGVDHVPLRAEGAFHDSDGPDVELAVLDVGQGGKAPDARVLEAAWIAARIHDLVGGGGQRTKVEPGAAGPRAFCYGDIAILLRARTDVQLYEEALGSAGIPFQTHKGRGYFQAQEVVDLVHALRVIHDPADDFALACLLTGPVLGLGDEDLLRLVPDPTAVRGDARTGLAWQAFVASGDARVPVLERLRREASAGHLGRVVEGVLHDLGLMDVALLQRDGARRAANLRKAVAVARGLEQGGRYDLGDLLRHLQALRDREVSEAEAALSGGEDVVRINTVHGAKGLEYPVVFLADVSRRGVNTHEPLMHDGGAGFATRLRHPLEGSAHAPAGHALLVAREKLLRDQEDRRLLYVAMTRAEERLILSGGCRGRRKTDGAPAHFTGWGAQLLEAFGVLPEATAQEIELPAGGIGRLAYVESVDLPATTVPALTLADVGDADRAEARALLAKAAEPTAPLGATPFLVTVSDLLSFARSPADWYMARLSASAAEGSLRTAGLDGEDPAAGNEHADPERGRAEERRLLVGEEHAAPDRAALGRSVHALLERIDLRATDPSPDAVANALLAEYPLGIPDGVPGALRAMALRFLRSRIGRSAAEALAAGEDLRREVAFHARIRFPAGERVAGFDSLLVRGSLDLWLPTAEGHLVVDYKTNAPSATFRTPEDVGRHYAVQLRLYALAAERLLGRDVAGASLLLLDPGWGPEAVEVPVDVGGPALEDARRICRAYAVAELEGRWPADWRTLLAVHGRR